MTKLPAVVLASRAPNVLQRAIHSPSAYHLTEIVSPCSRPTCECRELSHQVHGLLALLPPEKAQSLREEFGLPYCPGSMSREEVAAHLNIPVRDVRRIERKFMGRLMREHHARQAQSR